MKNNSKNAKSIIAVVILLIIPLVVLLSTYLSLNVYAANPITQGKDKLYIKPGIEKTKIELVRIEPSPKSLISGNKDTTIHTNIQPAPTPLTKVNESEINNEDTTTNTTNYENNSDSIIQIDENVTSETFDDVSEEDNTYNTLCTEDDLYWLARVIYAEAGCSWFPDWVQQAVGSVVLNRMNDSRYANTIYDVIHETGQYGCVNNGSLYNEPSQQCINNAAYILENGSTLPSGVIGQNGDPYGEVYTSYYDETLGTTIYFTY